MKNNLIISLSYRKLWTSEKSIIYWSDITRIGQILFRGPQTPSAYTCILKVSMSYFLLCWAKHQTGNYIFWLRIWRLSSLNDREGVLAGGGCISIQELDNKQKVRLGHVSSLCPNDLCTSSSEDPSYKGSDFLQKCYQLEAFKYDYLGNFHIQFTLTIDKYLRSHPNET